MTNLVADVKLIIYLGCLFSTGGCSQLRVACRVSSGIALHLAVNGALFALDLETAHLVSLGKVCDVH